MTIPNEGVESLVALGFTALEAEVYIYLLGASPATGYRVAQAIGKPIANTYKAIEALESKGAVIVEHSANKLCRAIPAEELLGQLEGTAGVVEWELAEEFVVYPVPASDHGFVRSSHVVGKPEARTDAAIVSGQAADWNVT